MPVAHRPVLPGSLDRKDSPNLAKRRGRIRLEVPGKVPFVEKVKMRRGSG
jgi:hypothetical protein